MDFKILFCSNAVACIAPFLRHTCMLIVWLEGICWNRTLCDVQTERLTLSLKVQLTAWLQRTVRYRFVLRLRIHMFPIDHHHHHHHHHYLITVAAEPRDQEGQLISQC